MSTINSNSTLTHLQSFLNSHTNAYQESMQKLSSGTKYNSVADNPVAVCHAEKLSSKIEANKSANSNVTIGSELLSTAESAQDNVIYNLERIRDLCIQAANGTYSSQDKDSILAEIKSRLEYINYSANSTNFNNIKLLDGSANSLKLQIGINSNDRINVGDALIDVHTSALDIDIDSSITGENWTGEDILNYMNKIDDAITKLIGTSSTLGAYLNRLDTVSDSLIRMKNNLIDKKSTIIDADVAEASANYVQNQILQQNSVSILTKVNGLQSLALSLFGR